METSGRAEIKVNISKRAQPSVRNEIVFRDVGDDVIVYDPVADRTTGLNHSSAAILALCDGTRTVADITAEISATLASSPIDFAEQIRDTLRRLAAARLLMPDRD